MLQAPKKKSVKTSDSLTVSKKVAAKPKAVVKSVKEKVVRKKKVAPSKHDEALYDSVLALHKPERKRRVKVDIIPTDDYSEEETQVEQQYDEQVALYKEERRERNRNYIHTIKNFSPSESSDKFVRYISTKNPLKNKKHRIVTQGVVVITVLVLIATYISPKSSAESVTFYPTSCLGGWNNVTHAEGTTDVEGNKNESKFTISNSAVLPSGMLADMYCGSFTGEFKKNTKPTKIILAISWAKGENVTTDSTTTIRTIVSESFASSTPEILDTSSTTVVNFTLATSTENDTAASSTLPGESTGESLSKDTTNNQDKENTPQTSSTTSLLPQTESRESTSSTTIVSFLDTFLNLFTRSVGSSAYAEEPSTAPTDTLQPSSPQIIDSTTNTPVDTPAVTPTEKEAARESSIESLLQKANDLITTSIILPDVSDQSTTTSVTNATGTFIYNATSSFNDVQSILTGSSPLDDVHRDTQTNTEVDTQSIQNENDEAQNNFLEVMYTYDGVTWTSLGKVNEESLVYRTFEVPVTPTTSWEDLSKLQVRVRSFPRLDSAPAIYLDGMMLDVVYETPVEHEHPDFARDTILQDVSDGALRVVNIINSDTQIKEIWYTAPGAEGGLNIASSSWVKIDKDGDGASYLLVKLYEKHLFWVDDVKKRLSVIDLESTVTDNVPLTLGSTTIPFMRPNGEPWVFEYNPIIKKGLLKIRVIQKEARIATIVSVKGTLKVKKRYEEADKESLVLSPPSDGNISTYSSSGVLREYIAVSTDPYPVSVDALPVGVTVFIFTTRLDGCSALPLDECRADSGYRGEAKVVVSAVSDTSSSTVTIPNDP